MHKLSLNIPFYNNIIYIPIILLFCLMLITPSLNQIIKFPFLIISLLFSIINIRSIKIEISYSILCLTLVCIITAVFFVIYGFINQAPGAFNVMSVYIVWPIVFTVLYLGYLNNEKIIPKIFSFFVFITIILSLYSIIFILRELGVWPHSLFFQIDPNQGIGIYEGKIEFRLTAISSLLYLGPLLIASIIILPNKFEWPVSKIWVYLGVLLAIIVGVLSGRRALQLGLVVSFVLSMLFRLFRKGNLSYLRKIMIKCAFLIVFIGLIAILLFEINFEVIFDDLISGFQFSGKMARSEYLRYIQFQALIEGWEQHPLFGNGLGSYTKKCIRSPEMPWAYELTYISLLFQIGLVGMLIYSLCMGWIVFKSIQIYIKDNFIGNYLALFIIATFTFMVGNATNPYLLKYDFIWIIFLPIGIINLFLVKYGKK